MNRTTDKSRSCADKLEAKRRSDLSVLDRYVGKRLNELAQRKMKPDPDHQKASLTFPFRSRTSMNALVSYIAATPLPHACILSHCRRSEDERPPAGSRGGAPVGSEGKGPQKSDIYTPFAAVKCFSTQVCCRVRPPSPHAPKNSSYLRESHDATRPGQVGHVSTRDYATAYTA